MMKVMNEVKYSFLYEVVREAFVEKYARVPQVGVTDTSPSLKVVKKEQDAWPLVGGPRKQVLDNEDTVSEAETEIDGGQECGNGSGFEYSAVAPPEGIREEIAGKAGGAGADWKGGILA